MSTITTKVTIHFKIPIKTVFRCMKLSYLEKSALSWTSAVVLWSVSGIFGLLLIIDQSPICVDSSTS